MNLGNDLGEGNWRNKATNSSNELLKKKRKLGRNVRTYKIKQNEHKLLAAKQPHVRGRRAKMKIPTEHMTVNVRPKRRE